MTVTENLAPRRMPLVGEFYGIILPCTIFWKFHDGTFSVLLLRFY